MPQLSHMLRMTEDVRLRIDESKILTAKVLIEGLRVRGILNSITEAEFKVFSQFGDDGIIQYLIQNIQIPNDSFIEFGVDNYAESNTRFLLINNNWRGLVMDSSSTNIDHICNSDIYWKYDLTAVHAFVSKENIDHTLSKNDFFGEIGILSIDIDGNDYWVWESITVVNPVVVIIEYNSLFGYHDAVTVPYDPDFHRTKSHSSNLYWGCSLKALCLLADRKGYVFAGSNSNGNNAYFVRKDKLGSVRPVTLEEGYVESRFRESRDSEGRLTYVSGHKRLGLIENMALYDIEKDARISVRDLKRFGR